MIFVLTAPVQSGKTTSLINWSANREDVYGILTPVVNGKRVFMNAHTIEQFPMEANEGGEEILTVGKFVFSQTNFNKAIQIIDNAIYKSGWLIVDEIGPLELRGEGFTEVVKEVVGRRKENTLLVVREGLAQQVKAYFNLQQAIIIARADELT